jgi:hypothetical protein
VTHFSRPYSSRSLISHLRKLIPEVRNSESGAESAVVAAVPEGEITKASCKQKSGRICAHRQNHERRPVLELFGARAASQNCNSHTLGAFATSRKWRDTLLALVNMPLALAARFQLYFCRLRAS